jgi:putative membrane protein
VITPAAGAICIAVYIRAVTLYNKKFPGRSYSFLRIACFVIGVGCIIIALLPTVDALADRSFAAHMAQHMVLALVAPPLVLLGAPLLLLAAVPSQRTARRITGFAHGALGRAIFAPITGWLLFVSVLWATHFSPLYEAALEHPAMHVVEHGLFLTAAFLFWGAVVQVGYAPRAVPFPARMLYVFLAIPQGAFLGLAIYAARGVLYPHYLQMQSAASALADQQNGGAVMWIAGGFIMFVAFMLTAAAWAVSERSPVRVKWTEGM